jgi:hypothetical protein
MKAKHTPTPWVIEGELDYIYVVNNESKDERACDEVRQVCHVCQGGYEYPDYDEALANAKLIAAAPAMLEALRYIATLDTSEDASPAQCSAVLVAMNAIDKATK